MKVSLAVALASMLAVTQAAPANDLVARKKVNDCGKSTYEDETSGGSPTVADCQKIVRNIANGGTWKVSLIGEQYTLVDFGTCAFGAEGNKAADTAHIGNADITDLINESIKRFQSGGRVGAKGKMSCQSDRGGMGSGDLKWGLYTNPNWTPPSK